MKKKKKPLPPPGAAGVAWNLQAETSCPV